MKDYKIIFLIVGTLFGAGFATGKELVVFFVKFGTVSLWAPLILFVLLSFSIYFLINYFKNKKNNKINQNNIIKLLFFIIYLIFSASMFSALTAFISYNFVRINYFLIVFIVAIFSYLILNKEIKFLTNINKFLVPIFVVLFIVICVNCSLNSSLLIKSKNLEYLLIPNSILYVGSNIVLLTTLLDKSATLVSNPKKVAILSSLIFSVLVMLGIVALLNNANYLQSEMPFLEIVKNNTILYYFFEFVFISAIITSLSSFLFATKNNFILKIKNSNIQNLICILLLVFVSLFGFSNIIENLYFVIGFLGFVLLSFLILSSKFCFYFTHNKVHKPSKYTKYDDACHN